MRRKRTLIISRRVATEPKAALACVTLESPLARFSASTAASSEESAISRRFVCWDFVAMAGTEAVVRKQCGARVMRKGRMATLSRHAPPKHICFVTKTVFAVKRYETTRPRSADYPESLFALVRSSLYKEMLEALSFKLETRSLARTVAS